MWGGGEKVFSLKLKYAHPSLSIASQDIVYFLYYSRSVYEIFKRILVLRYERVWEITWLLIIANDVNKF